MAIGLHPYLISVIFSPKTKFSAPFFSSQKMYYMKFTHDTVCGDRNKYLRGANFFEILKVCCIPLLMKLSGKEFLYSQNNKEYKLKLKTPVMGTLLPSKANLLIKKWQQAQTFGSFHLYWSEEIGKNQHHDHNNLHHM